MGAIFTGLVNGAVEMDISDDRISIGPVGLVEDLQFLLLY